MSLQDPLEHAIDDMFVNISEHMPFKENALDLNLFYHVAKNLHTGCPTIFFTLWFLLTSILMIGCVIP